jgi:hypothetical protein
MRRPKGKTVAKGKDSMAEKRGPARPPAPKTLGVTGSAVTPSAEARLTWMMEFCGIDLQRCSDSQRRALETEVSALSRRWGGRSSVRPGELEEAQKELRDFLTAMAQRQSYAVTAERVDWTFLQVEDDRRLPKSGKPPRPGAREPGRISRSYRAPAPVALVLHAADMLDFLKAERLIACPFIGKDGPCSKIFLATRRQRYCSEEHSKKAAWLEWLKRQGGSRAKNVPVNVPAPVPHRPHSSQRQPRAKTKTPR